MKQVVTTAFLFICFLCKSVSAQQFAWAYGEGGLGNDVATAITHDADGNIYVTGNVAGNVPFANSVASGTVFEVFLAKYSSSGSFQWVKTFGGLNNDKAQGITCYRNHLYVCGFFEGTATFGGTTLTSAGAQDVFVIKTDLSGNVVWARQAGGTSSDVANGISVDDAGNVYVCGSFRNSMNAGTLSASTANLSIESFVMSLDENGNFRWLKNSIGNSTNTATSVAFNHQNGISVCGYFDNRIVISGSQLNTPSPSFDAYLASFDLNGDLNWLKRAGSSAEDQGYAVACDKQGNTYMTGYYGGEISFGSTTLNFRGYNDAFIAKYDAAGNPLWARGAGGGNLDFATSVALDENNNCYISGSFEGSANFSGQIVTDADKGIFLASYDENGNFRFVQAAGGVQTDVALGVTVFNKRAFICGYYWFTCFFGSIGVSKADNSFLFVAAYNVPEVLSVNALSETGLSLYPNPFTDKLILKSSDASPTKVFLTDVNGRLLLEFIGNGTQYVDVSNLSSGVYFVHHNGTVQRVVKQ